MQFVFCQAFQTDCMELDPLVATKLPTLLVQVVTHAELQCWTSKFRIEVNVTPASGPPTANTATSAANTPVASRNVHAELGSFTFTLEDVATKSVCGETSAPKPFRRENYSSSSGAWPKAWVGAPIE